MRQQTVFDDMRLSLDEAIELTAQSLVAYGSDKEHWQFAYSGGKDSTATLSIALHLISTGRVSKPHKITVSYADTRQELPPLHSAALAMGEYVKQLGCDFQIAVAELDKRFWVNILGRGVVPPNNTAARWCTRQIKGEPMRAALQDADLVITGVRLGESAGRDQRIAMSCTKDGGECGQGWFQHAKHDRADTLAPILHWRVCHVWDWLILAEVEHGFPTALVAEAYSMQHSDGEEPLATRTGCIGCPLVTTEDTALARLVANPKWSYLAPLKEVRSIHDWLRLHKNRLRKDGNERKKDGSLTKNPGRIGCIKLEARLEALERLLDIQNKVNNAALSSDRPLINILNAEEEARIRELIALKTFPARWDGTELSGDMPIAEDKDQLDLFTLAGFS